jgi:hypothetical protein
MSLLGDWKGLLIAMIVAVVLSGALMLIIG